MKAAVDHHFNGTTEPLSGTYDPTKTMLGSLMRQSTGALVEDNFISARPSTIVNIPEVAAGAGNQMFPCVYKWSSSIYWIFTTLNAATAPRNVALFEFDSSSHSITYKGYVQLMATTPAVFTGNKTTRSMRPFVYEHTTGTVSTTGASTTIDGSGTGFVSERIAVGARIGFGTTDPTQVTTWYEITGITNDTTLTISGAVTLSPGTSYVIEEIRLAVAATGTTATTLTAGVFLVKGLNYGSFQTGGTIVTEASTVDNVRAVYLLTDAAVAGAQTATFTYSTTNILSCTGHGLLVNDVVYFTTTTTLPTGLSANTAYYVISTNYGANQFSVSTSPGGAITSITGAGTGTHTIHSGSSKLPATLGADEMTSFTDHTLYMVNATSSASLFSSVTQYNIRASLTVGALTGGPAQGVTPSAFVLKTAAVSHQGIISQANSGRIFTVSHGTFSGVKCLWFTTTTRVYRCATSGITSGSVSWLSDGGMIEVPPGGSTTYSALSSMAQVDYSATIDRLFIANSTNRFGIYVTQYNTSGAQFEKYIGANLNRLKVTTTPSGASDGLFPAATVGLWTEDGWMFALPSSTTSGQQWLYIFPFAADSAYQATTDQYVITPELSTPGATKLYHVYLDHQEYAGDYNLGFPVETYRLWYRTSGISDNTGAWTEIGVGADLNSVTPANSIQFKIAFDIMGEICVPTRVYSICCIYEDGSQDSHYQPSLAKSSAANLQFAWLQVAAWGSSIPNMRLRLYNAATGFLVLDDTITASASGDFEYYTDGGSTWLAWNSTADAVGNYIRYTADTLPNNITVRALLTQA